jgi:hypothetical protein
MPAAFASRMTLRDASLTAGISSAGTSIAGAGKETRYFVIVRISMCASADSDANPQSPQCRRLAE